MNTFLKAALSGAGGALLGDMIEPQLVKLFKPDTEFARKAAKAASIGLATGGIYYLLGRVG